MEMLEATVDSQIYAAEDSDFRILSVIDGKGGRYAVKGEFPRPALGIQYRFEGKWVDNQKFGKQFEASTVQFQRPASTEETLQFISRISGMTKNHAKKVLERFGAETMDRLASLSAGELQEITHEKPNKCEMWAHTFSMFLGREHIVAQLCELFRGCGIPQTAIVEMAARWGGLANETVTRNPWRIMEFTGVGFKRADTVYLRNGGRKDSLKRQALALVDAIESSESTWVAIVQAQASAEVSMSGTRFNSRAMELARRARIVVLSSDVRAEFVTTTQRDKDETAIAVKLSALCGLAGMGHNIDVNAMDKLSDHQRDQAGVAISKGVGCLIGGPGTGKTFCAAEIIRQAMRVLSPGSIAVVAPTGKAAVRLTEVMGNAGLPINAKTIHSFVGVRGIRNDGEILLDDATKSVSLVVVDESSMIPTRLLAAMLCVLPCDCCVLFLGDTGQLPPIGHGAPLRDIVASNDIPVGRLTEVRRNFGAIVRVCAEIANTSAYDPPKIVREATGDNAIHAECSASAILSRVESIFRSPPPGIDTLQIQVLSPLKKKDSPVGTPVLNERIRAIVNPSASGPLTVGDKVYVKKNESMSQVEKVNGVWSEVVETFVANGEFGIVVEVVPKGTGVKAGLVVKLDAPSRHVLVTQPSLLDFGWATTVHKSQGSEWPVVVTVVDKSAGMLGSKQLIYTAISRAKRLAVTIGQISTVAQWCKKDTIRSRRTMLTEKIRSKGKP